MRFLLDANMPRSATSTLLQLGHQVEFARDIGLAAASDEKVAAHAQATQAVLLTRDLDFADVRHYPRMNMSESLCCACPIQRRQTRSLPSLHCS